MENQSKCSEEAKIKSRHCSRRGSYDEILYNKTSHMKLKPADIARFSADWTFLLDRMAECLLDCIVSPQVSRLHTTGTGASI